MYGVLFSGNSLRNRDWIHDVQKQLGEQWSGTYVQEYKHWSSGADWIDLDHELAVLADEAESFEKPYMVFAKSMGTVLAVQAIEQAIIKPAALLLCGIPLDFLRDSDYPQFAQVLAAYPGPVIIVHNENDKVGDYADVAAYLAPALGGNHQIICTPGDTHDYEDYEVLSAVIRALNAAV